MVSATLIGGIVVAAAVWWIGRSLARELSARRRDMLIRYLLARFGLAAPRCRRDPRQMMVWYPLAQISRRLWPDAFAKLDAAAGGPFPFSVDDLPAAHAQWTADWLAWERTHDAEYKLKSAIVEEEAARRGEAGSAITRTRVGEIDREKLDRYQLRYEEYVRVAKALAALISAPAQSPLPSPYRDG